jgi:hypothetical protein
VENECNGNHGDEQVRLVLSGYVKHARVYLVHPIEGNEGGKKLYDKFKRQIVHFCKPVYFYRFRLHHVHQILIVIVVLRDGRVDGADDCKSRYNVDHMAAIVNVERYQKPK